MSLSVLHSLIPKLVSSRAYHHSWGYAHGHQLLEQQFTSIWHTDLGNLQSEQKNMKELSGAYKIMKVLQYNNII